MEDLQEEPELEECEEEEAAEEEEEEKGDDSREQNTDDEERHQLKGEHTDDKDFVKSVRKTSRSYSLNR